MANINFFNKETDNRICIRLSYLQNRNQRSRIGRKRGNTNTVFFKYCVT
jgi:hypothetical protein